MARPGRAGQRRADHGSRPPARLAELADRDRSFAPTTDRGDASGTCYFDATANRYRNDLVQLALGHDLELPRVAGPNEVIGHTANGIAIAPGTGDNMAGGLGLDVTAGNAIVSVGPAAPPFTKSHQQTHEPTGTVAGFADATGEFLPLVCTLNGARNLVATAEVLGVTLAELSQLALSAERGSQESPLCRTSRVSALRPCPTPAASSSV